MTAFWSSMLCMVLKTTAQIIIIRVFKVLRNNKFIVGYEQIYIKFIPKTASIKITVIPYYDIRDHKARKMLLQ